MGASMAHSYDNHSSFGIARATKLPGCGLKAALRGSPYFTMAQAVPQD